MKRTLNPSWEETFELEMPMDRDSVLQLSLWDEDTGKARELFSRSHDPLGKVVLNEPQLDRLHDRPGEVLFFREHLILPDGKSHGELSFSACVQAPPSEGIPGRFIESYLDTLEESLRGIREELYHASARSELGERRSTRADERLAEGLQRIEDRLQDELRREVARLERHLITELKPKPTLRTQGVDAVRGFAKTGAATLATSTATSAILDPAQLKDAYEYVKGQWIAKVKDPVQTWVGSHLIETTLLVALTLLVVQLFFWLWRTSIHGANDTDFRHSYHRDVGQLTYTGRAQFSDNYHSGSSVSKRYGDCAWCSCGDDIPTGRRVDAHADVFTPGTPSSFHTRRPLRSPPSTEKWPSRTYKERALRSPASRGATNQLC